MSVYGRAARAELAEAEMAIRQDLRMRARTPRTAALMDECLELTEKGGRIERFAGAAFVWLSVLFEHGVELSEGQAADVRARLKEATEAR